MRFNQPIKTTSGKSVFYFSPETLKSTHGKRLSIISKNSWINIVTTNMSETQEFEDYIQSAVMPYVKDTNKKELIQSLVNLTKTMSNPAVLNYRINFDTLKMIATEKNLDTMQEDIYGLACAYQENLNWTKATHAKDSKTSPATFRDRIPYAMQGKSNYSHLDTRVIDTVQYVDSLTKETNNFLSNLQKDGKYDLTYAEISAMENMYWQNTASAHKTR